MLCPYGHRTCRDTALPCPEPLKPRNWLRYCPRNPVRMEKAGFLEGAIAPITLANFALPWQKYHQSFAPDKVS